MSAVPEHGLLSLGTSELIRSDTRCVQYADTDVLGILLSVSWGQTYHAEIEQPVKTTMDKNDFLFFFLI